MRTAIRGGAAFAGRFLIRQPACELLDECPAGNLEIIESAFELSDLFLAVLNGEYQLLSLVPQVRDWDAAIPQCQHRLLSRHRGIGLFVRHGQLTDGAAEGLEDPITTIVSFDVDSVNGGLRGA